MATKSLYFKVGLFLIIGLAMITAAAIIFGLGQYFEETIPAESYFNYSVEGLETGSKVSYRGVEIGTVKSIGFVAEAYPDASDLMERYVLVRMDLYKSKVESFFANEDLNFAREVEHGLRVRQAIQGITGGPYVQMDYLNPRRNPVPDFKWEPDSIYIPSAPTTLGRLESMLKDFADTFKEVELGELVSTLQSLAAELRNVVGNADVENIGALVQATLTEAQELTARLNQIMQQSEAMEIIPNAANATRNVASLSSQLRDDLVPAVENIRQASEVLSDVFTDPQFKQAMNRTPEALDNITQAAAEIGRAADDIASTAQNLNELTVSQSQQIESLLNNLNEAARNFQELAEEMRRNPSQLFLSEPPARSPLD